jgi:putative intracellular protease/amidase
MELFSFLAPQFLATKAIPLESKYSLEATYVSYDTEPIYPSGGPPTLASRAFDDVKQDEQFDIILIPGGMTQL